MTEFIANRQIYERFIRDAVPRTAERLWIATANIKDLHVDRPAKKMVPFFGVFSDDPALIKPIEG